MNLNLNLSQYQKQTMDSSTISDASSLQRSAKSYSENSIKSIAVGQILTGEVSSVDGSNIEITLSNQQVVNAKVLQEFHFMVGQTLSFEVKSNQGSQIALTPLLENLASNSAAVKALQEASIQATETTLQMVSTMMDEGMGVDRNSLLAMNRVISEFEGADPKSIVLMMKEGIPLTFENISQFEQYQNNEHQIVEIASDLIGELSDFSSNGDIGVNQSIIQIFNGTIPEDVSRELQDGLSAMQQENIKEEDSAPIEKTELPKTLTDIMKEIQEEFHLSEAEILESEGHLEEELPDEITNNSILSTLSKFGMSKESLTLAANGEMSPQQLLSYVQAALSLADSKEQKDDLKSLLQGKDFQNLLKSVMQKEWTITPSSVENKEKIQELYQKILSQTEKTSQLLSQLGKGDSSMMKGAENLKQNVNFMNQLNQLYSYVQLPLKMMQGNAHGDLYVYANKKKLSQKDGEVTALLHLEMENLGTMNIHVALSDGNHVKTHFYLEKEEMLDFVEENLPILDERLLKRGYKMNSIATLRNTEDFGNHQNPVIDEMLGSKEQTLTARYSFDVRA